MIVWSNSFVWNCSCVIIDFFLFIFKSHKEARHFRFKAIPNWDDIVDLCAKDRATGHGAETTMDDDEVMSKEITEVNFVGLEDLNATIDLEEPNSNLKRKAQSTSSSTSTQSQRRNISEKKLMAASMKDVAESFKRLKHVYGEKVDENEIKEVLDEVRLMPNLTKEQWAKAVKWLADMPKQLAIVKALPIEQKEDYVLIHISTT